MRKIKICVAIMILTLSFSICYAAELNFTDVKTDDWFYKNIVEVMNVNEDFAKKFTGGEFKPNDYITIEETFEWLSYIFGDIRERKFNTLMDSSYRVADKFGETLDHYEYFAKPQWKNGYSYYGALNFSKTLSQYSYEKDDLLRRKDLADILYNGMTINNIHYGYDNKEYTDTKYNEPIIKYNLKPYNVSERMYISSKASDITIIDDEILFMLGEGIMTGKSDCKFHPYDYVTRAELITAISRIINERYKKPIEVNIEDPFKQLPSVNLTNIKKYPSASNKNNDYYNNFHKGYISSKMHEGIDYIMLVMNRDYRTISNNTDKYKQKLYKYLNAYKEYNGNEYNDLKEGLIYNVDKELNYKKMLFEHGFETDLTIKNITDYYEKLKSMPIDGLFDDFQNKFIEDTTDNQVIVQSEFYTDESLGSFVDGKLLDEYCVTRGVLRFKYFSHNNPDNIKEELDLVYRKVKSETEDIIKFPKDLVDIYMDETDIIDFEVGKWYEIEMDIITRKETDKYLWLTEDKSKYPELFDTITYNYKYIYPISIKEISK